MPVNCIITFIVKLNVKIELMQFKQLFFGIFTVSFFIEILCISTLSMTILFKYPSLCFFNKSHPANMYVFYSVCVVPLKYNCSCDLKGTCLHIFLSVLEGREKETIAWICSKKTKFILDAQSSKVWLNGLRNPAALLCFFKALLI